MYRYTVDNAVTYTPDDFVLYRESPFAIWMERLTLENPDHGILPDLHSSPPENSAECQDAIVDTLDYKAVSKRLIQFVEASDFQLVEALAEHCAHIVLEEFPVEWLRLKLSKPGAVRGSSAVGVIIERGATSA